MGGWFCCLVRSLFFALVRANNGFGFGAKTGQLKRTMDAGLGTVGSNEAWSAGRGAVELK